MEREREKNLRLKDSKNLLNLVTFRALGKVFLKIAALTTEAENFLSIFRKFFLRFEAHCLVK